MTPFEWMLLTMLSVTFVLWFACILDVRKAKKITNDHRRMREAAWDRLDELRNELRSYARTAPNVRVATVTKRLKQAGLV